MFISAVFGRLNGLNGLNENGAQTTSETQLRVYIIKANDWARLATIELAMESLYALNSGWWWCFRFGSLFVKNCLNTIEYCYAIKR